MLDMAPKVSFDTLKDPVLLNTAQFGKLNQAKIVMQQSSIRYDKRQIIIYDKERNFFLKSIQKFWNAPLWLLSPIHPTAKIFCVCTLSRPPILEKNLLADKFFYIKRVIKESLKCQKKSYGTMAVWQPLYRMLQHISQTFCWWESSWQHRMTVSLFRVKCVNTVVLDDLRGRAGGGD